MRPFRIHVADSAIADLRARLRAWREPEGETRTGGIALDEIRRLVRVWTDDFDWRAQETELNRLPQFETSAGETTVHFVHLRSAKPDAMPLLLLHGWPGSFLEFRGVIPLLSDFHLVIPSLPGYGFSPLNKAGFSNSRIADVMAALMTELRYERFGIQGGDWGAGIGTWMALKHPHRVVALHLNYIPGSFQPPDEEWDAEYGAYAHLQRTRPLTAAYGLSDSPAGLAAWIYEKFVEWADPETLPPLDDILLNISLYWFTNTIHSSMRLYLESVKTPLKLTRRVDAPAGILKCRLEAPFPPRDWIERGYDIRRWTESPRGGHFAAMEVPEVLAADVNAFFASFRA